MNGSTKKILIFILLIISTIAICIICLVVMLLYVIYGVWTYRPSNEAADPRKSEISEVVVRDKINEYLQKCEISNFQYKYEYFPETTTYTPVNSTPKFYIDISTEINNISLIVRFDFSYPNFYKDDNEFDINGYSEKVGESDVFRAAECPLDSLAHN